MTIDDRMAELHEEHVAAGVRPETEEDPTAGDLYETTLPLRLKGHAKTVAEEVEEQKAEERAKAERSKRASNAAKAKASKEPSTEE